MTTRQDRQRGYLARAYARMLDRYADAMLALARSQTRQTEQNMIALCRAAEKTCESLTIWVEGSAPKLPQ
jgi:hypothetical protein